MTSLPVLNLDDFRHPDCDEWVYGPRRTGWVGGHPITASAEPAPGEPVLAFQGPLGLDRDEIPHLIAWLTAVHAATDPEGSETAVVTTSLEWGVGDPDDCADDETVREISGPHGMSITDPHYGRKLLCRDVARGPWRRANDGEVA